MAIYRFEARIIGRADNALGRSIVACAAYRAGERLHDEKYEQMPDYSRRSAGISYSKIHTPECAPSWATDREQFWNSVERAEDGSTRRKTAQLAREFIPALPHELTQEERQELVTRFVDDELVSRGMVVDVAIHEPKEGLNHHAHLLCSMRDIDENGFGKKNRSWNDDKLLEEWREKWERYTNEALEAAGCEERVDRRSLAERGIDAEPQPKLGPAAAAMERKGIETERGELVRDVAHDNRFRTELRGLKDSGEVSQWGIGATWWERTQSAFAAVADQARELWRDESSGGAGLPSPNWQSYEALRRQPESNSPQIEYG